MSFAFLLLYLFIIYIRPGDWIPALSGWRLLALATAGTGFFLVFQVAMTKQGFVKAPQNKMMLGLVVAAVLSHVAHTYFAGVISSLGALMKLLILYIFLLNIVRSRGRCHATLLTLVILTLVLAVQGIQQAQHGYGWGGQPLLGAYGGRITWIGIFEDPNDLALAFVMVVPILLSYIFSRSFIGKKYFAAFALIPVIYAVYLTKSRGGLLALLVAVAFYFIKKSKFVVTGGIVAGIFAVPLFLFAPSRMGALSTSEASAYGRLDAWYYGFQLLKSNPLFGVGHNLFTDRYPLTAHNSFVLAFAEMGLLGLFFWVGLLYTSFKSLSIVQKRYPPLQAPAYGLQAALVGFGAAAFFLSRTYIMLPYLLFGLSAAFLNVAREATGGTVDFRLQGRDVRNIGLCCLGILVLLQVAMKAWL